MTALGRSTNAGLQANACNPRFHFFFSQNYGFSQAVVGTALLRF